VVEFQRLTGCRPGESCRLRRRDIDTGGPISLYRPPHHKTARRGKSHVVAVGARADSVGRGLSSLYLSYSREAVDSNESPLRTPARNP